MSVEEVPWVDQFWSALTAPASVADFLLGLFGAALAFGGAFWLFRRQLEHDRRLARQQLESDRVSRMSDVRRAAASKLGLALIETASEFNNFVPTEMAAAMDASGVRSFREPLGAARIYDAYHAALHEIDMDDMVLRLWRLRSRWWHAVKAVKDDPRIAALPGHLRGAVLFTLVDHFYARNGAELTELGRILLRWDGEGSVPTLVNGPDDEGVKEDKQAAATAAGKIADSIAIVLKYR